MLLKIFTAIFGRVPFISSRARANAAGFSYRNESIPLQSIPEELHGVQLLFLTDPHIGGNIEWIGEICDQQKFKFLAAARAVLAPIQWDEPCANIVMESLACGTPIITTHRGCMPELIRNGVTGFLTNSEDEMAQAVANVGTISRQDCLTESVERFTTDRMVEAYLEIARALISEKYEVIRNARLLKA